MTDTGTDFQRPLCLTAFTKPNEAINLQKVNKGCFFFSYNFFLQKKKKSWGAVFQELSVIKMKCLNVKRFNACVLSRKTLEDRKVSEGKTCVCSYRKPEAPAITSNFTIEKLVG